MTEKCHQEPNNSDPVCGMTAPVDEEPGLFSFYICGAESPWLFGGSFNLETTLH